MAPKKKFAKETITEAAFEIAKTEGLEGITIRKVAEKLGSSIAPIYVNFKDVDELIREVVKWIFRLTEEMLIEVSSGRPFYDIGVASLKFAKEYKVLFRDLIMRNNEYLKDYDDHTGQFLINEMKKDPMLDGFNDKELKEILFKMRVYQTGLSVMVANGLLPVEYSEEKLIKSLESTARDVITSMRYFKVKGSE
ncbi:TetR/AcrR family transcriptional regulator [Serpentinicella alkaliphila]|uniref:TetR family transcriptional regulator n=1 Tax=Serpentinicella alkaliphila TaxID=1734049 RepID=A0A4R2TG76_9FIRM|nr:TetR family transcriptional regulator [Serpentinicella alkaliphila]QUH27303.1 TetR/AcrR family transcriptional regulator [Serpentinicella alkaliphila]TCQ01696.1 TetR family transcriptional regulator [Serpentinicella alkaliphila]